ncbi:hypothetical protein F5X68DRAFT_229620 [Plectosphaerella plurivora]|uniref:Uncharacterized protein n=1 Tax=Plectosphaerella plurivora TaxID=936078 RepID=A0A9P8VH69_9PEZI|nr:hypothetical protein F5X68DRAFT_229620 [Plectosphaerella plurivora]
MSRASKLTLAATGLFAASTVVISMHEGVVRDMEQQRVKRERQLDFDLQKALEAEYKKEQTVKSSVLDALPDSSKGPGSTER